jgi:hypothetical protein
MVSRNYGQTDTDADKDDHLGRLSMSAYSFVLFTGFL